jgi:hypothetical protein
MMTDEHVDKPDTPRPEPPKGRVLDEGEPPKKFCAFCHKVEKACRFLFNGRTPGIFICDVCVGDSMTTLRKVYHAIPNAKDFLQHRYNWVAQYDDGTFFPQFDRDKVERSVGKLNWERVVRLDLIPQIPGYFPVEVHVDRNKGETGIKFWQVTQEANEGKVADVREVVGLKIDPAILAKKHVQVFVMLSADGRIVVTSEPNCP